MIKACKRISSLLALTILIALPTSPRISAAPFAGEINIDGVDISSNAKPAIINGTLLVPFRSVVEALGLNVSWNKTTNMITGENDSTHISLKPDQTIATINGLPRSFSHAPYIDKKSNQLYVELRFISEVTGASVQWNNEHKIATINTKKNTLPSSSTTTELAREDGIILSANQAAVNGVYKGITVQSGKAKKSFDWVNVANPSFNPVLTIEDVNNDDQKEIIVILTNATGTEVNQQEIHVLNPDLLELSTENPLDYIHNKVSSSITEENGQVNVLVRYDGSTTEKKFSKSDAALWFNNVSFGSLVEYRVENKKITATIPGQVSPTLFAVKANIEYGADFKIAVFNIEKN